MMTPATILRQAQADGVMLALSPSGTIKATGDAATVNRWLAVIREHKAEIIDALRVGAGDTATASHWWRIRYSDRDPQEFGCYPEATHDQVLERHPDAIAAEPFEPTVRAPLAPITTDEQRAVLAWLAEIGETDEATIADVLNRCRVDADAAAYFLKRASKIEP